MTRSLFFTTAICALAAPAFAQSADDIVADDISADVIIVTAQKREQLITDVPVTVTAFGGEALERIGVDEFDELSAFVPGLNVQEQSANNPGFVIRGITSDSGSAQVAPRVTIYYDGVDVSRSRGSYFKFFDIDRVEVVKGPQATLFGTAATIGAISVIPNKPEPGMSAFVSASYGNLDAYEANGVINVGGEVLAGRLAGYYERRDGYVRNIAGEPGTVSADLIGIDQDDLNGIEQFGVRGSVRAYAGDGTIDLAVSYEQQDNPGTAFKSGTIQPTGGDTSPFTFAELGGSPFSDEVLGISELKLERDVLDVNLTIEVPVTDAVTVTTIAGYRQFDSLETFDADGSALFFLEFAEDAQGEQVSAELRADYDDGGLLRGFVGINFFAEDGTQAVPFSTEEGTYLFCALGNCQDATALVAAPLATGEFTQGAAAFLPYQSTFVNGGDNTAYSLFADVTFAPVDRLELTAGVRYIIEDRRSTFFADQPNSVLTGSPLLPVVDTAGQTFAASDRFDAWLPRFNALFEVTDGINVYGTVSKGRRAPVLDLSATAGPAGPVPDLTLISREKVWNYEGGVKGSMLGITGSVGVFYQDYSNFQTSFTDEGGIVQPVDAGQASNFGVEVEAAIRPTEWLRVFGSYAYIDAEIDEPADNAFPGIDFVGSRFRLQPEHSAAGGIDISYELGDGIDLSLTPTVTYRSRVFFEIPNDPAISQGGYTLANLRGGVSFGDGRYAITGFATNLFDEEFIIDAGNTGGAFGLPTFISGEPRLYGVEVSARF
ncbi:MAG: TonB-dependent receptor [Pacificimonas sp.]